MQEERIEIDGVPANLYTIGDPSALLLLGHGGEHSKDGPRFVRLSRTYAERTGLAVVCIDAVDHGERKPLNVEGDGIPAQWHSSNVDQMVADWQTVATGLDAIGPPLAYVGFSMGAIFGFPTVAEIPSIQAAVFVAGGIPTGGGIEDPPLRPLLLDAAARLDSPSVLMLNKTDDSVFSMGDSSLLFDAIPSDNKRLMFSEGGHDYWPDTLIDESVAFIQRRVPQDT